MIATKENLPRFTPKEYFAWEEQQQVRHEYIDGEVYATTGGTVNHSQITSNFNRLLGNHLRGSGCKVLNSDARVNIVASTHYVYPDVSVTCDERDKTTTQYITYPCLIVEVLSASTEAYDRGNKFKLYRRNPSLQEYILVDAETIAIELFRKVDGDHWRIIDYEPGDLVELTSIKLTFSIEQVYEDVVFATEKSSDSY
ncbi:Uma2 family endonuclease [Altericista sp. CCNU0014]|uniref:Uma2 family endonuclease n=1 Tax=Altericista sp. CCNU0014 TaxID=3082949 RepID=UPI00384FB054